MTLLVVTVCLMTITRDVQCHAEVFRMERTPAACAAMLKPVHAWMIEASAGLPVLVVTAACKRGTVA